jgi:hypothetical protein
MIMTMTKTQSKFTNYADGIDTLQIEVVGDNEAMYLVAAGERLAVRENKRWVSLVGDKFRDIRSEKRYRAGGVKIVNGRKVRGPQSIRAKARSLHRD